MTNFEEKTNRFVVGCVGVPGRGVCCVESFLVLHFMFYNLLTIIAWIFNDYPIGYI
jgi:hypothetical protein